MAIHGGPAGAEVGLADTSREFQLETRIGTCMAYLNLGGSILGHLPGGSIFGQKCIYGTKNVEFFDYSEAFVSTSLTTRRQDRPPRRPKMSSDPLFSSLSPARLDLPRPQLAENRSEHENGRLKKTSWLRIDKLFKPNWPPRAPPYPQTPPGPPQEGLKKL